MKLTDQTVMRLCHKHSKTLSNAPDNIIAEGNGCRRVTTTNIHASLGKLCVLINSSPFGQHLFPSLRMF